MRKKRRKFSSGFEAKVAIEALKERRTLAELAEQFELHPNQISQRKQEFLSNADSVFETRRKKDAGPDVALKDLYAKIGRLEMERDFLKKSLNKWDQLK